MGSHTILWFKKTRPKKNKKVLSLHNNENKRVL